MNAEIGTEAAQFPEKEYINGIFVAVYCTDLRKCILVSWNNLIRPLFQSLELAPPPSHCQLAHPYVLPLFCLS